MGKIYYPIAVKIKGAKAIVVGGGKVGERKALSLLEYGGRVTVISPEVTEKLEALVKARKVEWIARRATQKDLAGARIVIAATSQRSTNIKISAWARRAGALVNVVDDKALSDFISPAMFKNGKAIVTVYTDGRDPALSRDLKNFLEEKWDVFLSHRHRS